MILGIQNFHYYASDMQKAVKFYTYLGMTNVFGDDFWTSFNAWGVTFGLQGTNGKPIPRTPCDSQKLETFGAKILGETDAPWGHMLVFQDLDGNILSLMKPRY